MSFSDDALKLGATALSYSKLKLALQCPFSFQKKYTERTKPTNFVDSSKAIIGTSVHTIIEESLERLQGCEALSEDLMLQTVNDSMSDVFTANNLTKSEREEIYYLRSPIINMVGRFLNYKKANSSRFFLEEELAIDENFEPVPYASKEAFFRGKIDLLIINPNGVVAVIDHKTGYKTMRGNENQLISYEILVAFALAPKILAEHNIKIKSVHSGLSFVNEGEIVWSNEKPMNYVQSTLRDKFAEWVNTASGDAIEGKIRRGKHCNYCGYRSFCGSKVGTRKKKGKTSTASVNI